MVVVIFLFAKEAQSSAGKFYVFGGLCKMLYCMHLLGSVSVADLTAKLQQRN